MTLAEHLTRLEAAGLIRLAVSQPDLEYLFRHALIQDAAYGSLVKHDRKRLHLAVGRALEQAYPDRLASQDLAALLGHHFALAGDDARAAGYFTAAGDAAARAYANAEAALHYRRALDLLRPAADSSGAAEHLVHLYTGLGQALELRSHYDEALALYNEFAALAADRGDRQMEFAALMARAKIHTIVSPVHDPARARELLDAALRLSRAMGDRPAEAKVLWNLMILLVYAGGDQRQAIALGEESLAISRELKLREQLAFTLNDLTYAYLGTLQYGRAREALGEAQALWRELGNMPMQVDSLCNSALIAFETGDFDAAVALTDEAMEISRSIENVWGQASSRFFVGNVFVERGELDRAIEVMEETIRLGEAAGHAAAVIGARADLARVYGTLGAIERGLESARLAQAKSAELSFLRVWPMAATARLHILRGDLAAAESALEEGYRELKPEGIQMFAPMLLPLAEAELALAKSDHARALEVLDRLLAFLERCGVRAFAADALYLKGRTLLELGQEEESRVILLQGQAVAEALGARRPLWPILAALSDIEARRGNGAEADALAGRARAIVEYIADRAGSPDLRASFLALPRVRGVLGAAE